VEAFICIHSSKQKPDTPPRSQPRFFQSMRGRKESQHQLLYPAANPTPKENWTSRFVPFIHPNRPYSCPAAPNRSINTHTQNTNAGYRSTSDVTWEANLQPVMYATDAGPLARLPDPIMSTSKKTPRRLVYGDMGERRCPLIATLSFPSLGCRRRNHS